jgi:orotate phosphoribosyltransferase
MTPEQVLAEFKEASHPEGHFILSSEHSDTYMQCARVLMDADRAGRIQELTAKSETLPKATIWW